MKVESLVGQRLAQYELRELIGTGGMGAVYRAYQSNLKREVAVKVLPFAFAQQPGATARFDREAEISASLEHAHIVPVHDYGTERDISYVVMRLLGGGSLSQRLRQSADEGRPLPSPQETASLLRQLAGALDYAHSRGVIHRDIKPGNIMFDNQGDAFLVDFGIARLIAGSSGLTGTGTVGTPNYMAPEQWRGETLTPAADQYSLAVVIYNMLSGRLPLEANTPYALMHKLLNEQPTPINVWRAGLPSAVQVVLERAMAKDPKQRFPTATAFSQAFSGALSGIRDETTNFFVFPVTPTGATAVPVTKNPSNPSNPSVTVRPPPTRARPPALWIGSAAILVLLGALGLFAFMSAQNTPRTDSAAPVVAPSPTPTETLSSVIEIVQPPTATVVVETTADALAIVLEPSATLTPAPTETDAPTTTPVPTDTPRPTETAVPSATPTHTPTDTPTLTDTPAPTVNPRDIAQATRAVLATIDAELTALAQEDMTRAAAKWTHTPTPTLTPTATLAPPTALPTRLPTLTPIPARESCSGAPTPRLVVGEGGRNRTDLGDTMLRGQANSGVTVYEMPEGYPFVVRGGPECHAGSNGRNRWWWYVETENGFGWAPEGEGSTYWLEPMGRVPPNVPACGDAPPARLFVGEAGRNMYGGGNTSVRNTPGGTSLYSMPEGEVFAIVGGPVCQQSARGDWHRWWLVLTDRGIEGYMPEGEGDTYWLEPWTVTGDVLGLAIGVLARVFVRDEGLKLRSGAGTSHTIVENLPSGTLVTLIGGPTRADGLVWWRVRAPSGAEGWVVEAADDIVTLTALG